MKIHRTDPFRALAIVLAVACGSAWAETASMESPATVDWSRYAEVETVEVLTTDADGDARETTIWLVVVDGSAFIRTGATNWGDNVERDPSIALRIEDEEIPVRAYFVEDEALRERVVAKFREKYGFIDGVMDLFRGDHPRIMRIEPRV